MEAVHVYLHKIGNCLQNPVEVTDQVNHVLAAIVKQEGGCGVEGYVAMCNLTRRYGLYSLLSLPHFLLSVTRGPFANPSQSTPQAGS